MATNATNAISNDNKLEESSVPDLRQNMAIFVPKTLLGPIGKPVHEMLTLAALINSDYKLDSSITYEVLKNNPRQHPEINDFLRGVMYNDDPECELFDEEAGNNLKFSTGSIWGLKYQLGGFTKPELIHRSHHGDLQWLHAMALGMDPPQQTKESILEWMKIMYNIAVGAMSTDVPLSNTVLGALFENPQKYFTVGELLTQRHSTPANIPNRALGSCFHCIQDSYAIGHTSRERLNKDALHGEPDRWGAVLNFHSYGGQSEKDHKHFDHGEDKNIDNINLRSLDAWNMVLGCRDGLDKCIQLANFWHRKAPWSEVQDWLDTEVFAIHRDATPSNNIILWHP